MERNKKGGWELRVLDDEYLKSVGFFAVEEMEIIGNKFGNPELLEVKDD